MALNRRLFTLRRLRNHLNDASLLKLVDGLFNSKIRYGLQLMAKVRMEVQDPVSVDIENIQKVQNKLLRMLTNTKLLDMVSTAALLEKKNQYDVCQSDEWTDQNPGGLEINEYSTLSHPIVKTNSI